MNRRKANSALIQVVVYTVLAGLAAWEGSPAGFWWSGLCTAFACLNAEYLRKYAIYTHQQKLMGEKIRKHNEQELLDTAEKVDEELQAFYEKVQEHSERELLDIVEEALKANKALQDFYLKDESKQPSMVIKDGSDAKRAADMQTEPQPPKKSSLEDVPH